MQTNLKNDRETEKESEKECNAKKAKKKQWEKGLRSRKEVKPDLE
jgi:hypothetical protein